METALEVAMTEHLGYDKHAVDRGGRGNSPSSTQAKAGLTKIAHRADRGVDAPPGNHAGLAAVRLAVTSLCIAYVMWRPVSAGVVLYPVLGVMTLASVPTIRHLSRWFISGWFLLTLAVTMMALVGSVNDNIGLTQQSIQWFGTLTIWGVWAASITEVTLRQILTVVAGITAVLSGAIVMYVAAQQGVFLDLVPKALLRGQDAGYDETGFGSAIRFYGLSTLAGAGPLVAAGAVSRAHPLLPSRRLLIVAAFLAAVASLVAGRRAILVVTLAAPFVFIALRGLLTPRTSRPPRISSKWVVMSPALFIAGVLAWSSTLGRRARSSVADAAHVYLGVGGGGDTAAMKTLGDADRNMQSNELFAAWGAHPLLGSGLGAKLPSGYSRSADRPWLFELQYQQLLFNGGLVAVLLIAAALVLTVSGFRAVARRRPGIVPVLAVVTVGAVSMLISNASNPYLQAVGHGWPVALAVGAGNALARTSRGAIGQKDMPDAT